ncbi:hypothetical protein D3C87_1488850 [compost metagenome]
MNAQHIAASNVRTIGTGLARLFGRHAITTPTKPMIRVNHCQPVTRSLRIAVASTVTMIGAEKYRVVISARVRSRAAV